MTTLTTPILLSSIREVFPVTDYSRPKSDQPIQAPFPDFKTAKDGTFCLRVTKPKHPEN